MSHVPATADAVGRLLSQASAQHLLFCQEGFDFSKREGLERNTTFGNDPGSGVDSCCPALPVGQDKGGLSCATCWPLKGCLCRRPPAPPYWGGTVPPTATAAEKPSPANRTFLDLLADSHGPRPADPCRAPWGAECRPPHEGLEERTHMAPRDVWGGCPSQAFEDVNA